MASLLVGFIYEIVPAQKVEPKCHATIRIKSQIKPSQYLITQPKENNEESPIFFYVGAFIKSHSQPLLKAIFTHYKLKT